MRGLRVVAFCALAAAVPAVALAASTPRVTDRDDTAGAVDLKRVQATHNRVADEIVYVIETHEPLTADALRNRSGPPGSICVNAWTSRTPGEAAPNYEICITPGRGADDLRASVARVGATGGSRRLGAAKLAQPTATRLELRFDPDRIRRPSAFRWTVQATTFSDGCPGVTGCEDFVPDRPKTGRTEIRAARR